MNFYTVLKLLKEFKINPHTAEVRVSDVAADISGTSANLIEGDVLTIQQLFYGMMLPSGNDAAFALA